MLYALLKDGRVFFSSIKNNAVAGARIGSQINDEELVNTAKFVDCIKSYYYDMKRSEWLTKLCAVSDRYTSSEVDYNNILFTLHGRDSVCVQLTDLDCRVTLESVNVPFYHRGKLKLDDGTRDLLKVYVEHEDNRKEDYEFLMMTNSLEELFSNLSK